MIYYLMNVMPCFNINSIYFTGLFWTKYGEVFPSVDFLYFSPLTFHGVEMLTNIDWTMHAKATRSMALRSLRHGETETAKRLFQAASRMETIAREAIEVSVASSPRRSFPEEACG